jgi:hypothetical protein
MGRTLLVGNPAVSWREWEKEHRGTRDWVCLDPSDANHGLPARFTLWRGDKPLAWRFYGSLDARRFPLVVPAALAELSQMAAADAVVQLFPFEPSPVLRHLAILVAQLLQPSEILLAKGTAIDLSGWPVGPEEIEIAGALPIIVQAAQRKAHWLKLVEECVPHEVDLRQVSVEGSRLGSGKPLTPSQLEKTGIGGVVYGEVCGGTLMAVTDEQPDEDSLSRSLAVFHCSKAHIVDTTGYDGLLCSFGRQSGEDIGTGMVQRIDFAARKAHVLCTATAGAPVRILRLGALRLDTRGRESGEVRPWQV